VTRFRRAFGRLHRDEGGQIVPLFVLGAIGLVLLVIMILNTGRAVVSRTETQNAADAVVITQASWTARSMNLMAMNNVGVVQAYSLSMVSGALAETFFDASVRTVKLAIEIIGDIASNCPYNIFSCGWAIYRGIHLATVVIPPLIKVGLDTPWKAGYQYKQVAIGFDQMNTKLVAEFPKWSREVARRVAEKNGVDDPLFYSEDARRPWDTTPLPVKEGPIAELPPYGVFRLCEAAEKGTKDWLKKFFKNFEDHGYKPDHGAHEVARNDANKSIVGALKGLCSQPPPGTPALLALFACPHQEYDKEQSDDENQFTRALDDYWDVYCKLRLPPAHVPGVNWVVSARVPDVSKKITLWTVKHRPLIPFAFDQETREKMSLVAFTRRREKAAVSDHIFSNPPGATYAYAQAEVYNAEGTHDLMTQDWRARLVPAWLLETRNKRSRVQEVVRRDYGDLWRVLKAGAMSELEVVNAH
jgi:hypothetical protein